MAGKNPRAKDGATAKALSPSEYEAVNAAVAGAEERSGLEFMVMFGSVSREQPRAAAEHTFHTLGLQERPAVMIVVVPSARSIEILTAAPLHGRLSNLDCEEAVSVMTGLFAVGDLPGGLIRGVDYLAERAGNGERTGADLPNVVDLDE